MFSSSEGEEKSDAEAKKEMAPPVEEGVQLSQTVGDKKDAGPIMLAQAASPRGTFGSILHVLTLGLFGDQAARTSVPVNPEYQVKHPHEQHTSVDQHPYEEYDSETVDN